VGLLCAAFVHGQEDNEEDYEEYEDGEDEEGDEEYEEEEEAEAVPVHVEPEVHAQKPETVVNTQKHQDPVSDSSRRVVSFEFRLRKPEPVTLSQLEARDWVDPAWDMNISGTDEKHLKDISMIISGLMQSGNGRLYSLKNGDPFHYRLVYKFHCPRFDEFTHYNVNGGPLHRLDEVSQIGVREVTVLPYNWCPYLNGENIDPNVYSLIRKYESEQRLNDPDFALQIDRESTRCFQSPTPGNVIVRCLEHYHAPGNSEGAIEYSFDLLPTRKTMLRCFKVNSCEPEGKCGIYAKCIPQERGEFKCVCKEGYRPPINFIQSQPSEPINCVDYCSPGQEGNLRQIEMGSPYVLCVATPDKIPYYELKCAKGSSMKNGVCVKDCACHLESTDCVVDAQHFEHICRCKLGYEPVPESTIHCKPVVEKRSAIELKRDTSYMTIDQCSTYSEPGYVVTGNTGEIDDFDVQYHLPHQLAEEMIVNTGTYFVKFWLTKKPDQFVTRTVKVHPVNRCLPKYSSCGIQCKPGMICQSINNVEYPRDINCTCSQPAGCRNWQDAKGSSLEVDTKYYDFITAHEKLQHSTVNRETCLSTAYFGNYFPNETQCVDVAPPVIFLLGRNPSFVTSCIVCFDELHPNSSHTVYSDEGAISYDYFDSEKKELVGRIQGEVKPLQDAPPLERHRLQELLSSHGYENFEDVSYSVYRYEASDRTGNVAQFDRHVFYITTNISKEVMKLVELQRQLDNIGEVVSYIKQFAIAVLVIVLFWFLFTAEGQRLLRGIFKKLLNPEQPWGAIQADLDAVEIARLRERKRNNSRGSVNDS